MKCLFSIIAKRYIIIHCSLFTKKGTPYGVPFHSNVYQPSASFLYFA